MIGQTAILLIALLASVVLAVMTLVLAGRARRAREDARHEREVARRRLLALTGGEGPTWSGSVAVSEVLHAATRALGEEGQDVTRRADTNRTLPAPVAQDVCLILTELIDNALCFSDVSEEVTVFARAANDGSLLVEVEDSGDGMSRDDLRLANRTLKGTPPEGEEEGLGLVLVGRLSARHGVRVVLAARGDGTMASVVIPPSVASGAAPQRPSRPASPPSAQAPATPARPPRQPVSSADSGESTAAWTPPWAGGGEGQPQPAGAGRQAAQGGRRTEPPASPRPAPSTAPHGVPARAAAAGSGYPPPRRPQPPAPPGTSGTGLPLPPAPPSAGSNAPNWLTSSPDADPAGLPDLGGYPSMPGSDPYGGSYRNEGYAGTAGSHDARQGGGVPEFNSPIFDSVASRWFDNPSSTSMDQYAWQSPADQGWSAVERAYGEPTPPGGTLPRREPMSHLVPGSVQQPSRPQRSAAWDEPRSPDTWAAYQSQVDHGRRAWFRQVGDDADDLGDNHR